MSFPTIVAFSWGPDKYHDAARRLRRQCEELDLPHRITVAADLTAHFKRCPGRWMDRKWVCRYIPSFLLAELDGGGEDLLYLHGDFQVHERIPEGVFDGMDIGLQRRWLWKPESKLEVLAAPIFVRQTPAARRFLRLWESYCLNIDDGNFEHMHLYRVWRLMSKTDRTLRLEYFDPPIATLVSDANVPITGHKS